MGLVRRESSRLVSADPVVHALLSFAQVDQPFPPQVASTDGVRLELVSRRDPEKALEEFKDAFTVETAQLMPAADSSERTAEKIDADIHIPLLLKEALNNSSMDF
ncbi:hypothetical protein Xkhy_16880 [Xanthomonas axonopodis pv. khayae]|nr:hypothetical protein Xkhy_16880 [Xanthomonas axonopodis pv. khayae]